MSLSERAKKINKIVVIILIAVLLVFLVYGIGIIALGMGQKEPITLQNNGFTDNITKPTKTEPVLIVASKKGKKYYLVNCSGAKTIAAQNKIYFDNEAAALRAGYTPSSTCKGLNAKP